MPRIPLVDSSSLESPLRERVEGHPIGLYRTLAHIGDGFMNFSNLGRWIRHESHVDGRMREMAILSVGWINHSPYEFSHHIKIGRDFGLSDADIHNILDYLDGKRNDLGAEDALIVDATREITLRSKLDDQTWDALKARLGQETLIELTVIISFYSAVTRILGTLEVEVEEGYRGYLAEFGFDS